MKKLELKAERIKQGKDGYYMAGLIDKSYSMYSKKERGVSEFTPEEIVTISNDLKLTLPQINALFFDSKLTEWQV